MRLTTQQSHELLEVFRFISETKSNCGACGAVLPAAGSFRVPGVGGAFCSVLCIEAALFGGAHCRWCGRPIDRPYSSLKDRLCSPPCEEQFFQHVHGDYAAELGRGLRLLLWLQHKQPAIYRQIIDGSTPAGRCKNQHCPHGENGLTASLTHLRAGAKYCSETCSEQARRARHAQRVLTGTFDPSQTPVLRGFSRHTSGELDYPPYPVVSVPRNGSEREREAGQ
jgi:hypothetical protein